MAKQAAALPGANGDRHARVNAAHGRNRLLAGTALSFAGARPRMSSHANMFALGLVAFGSFAAPAFAQQTIAAPAQGGTISAASNAGSTGTNDTTSDASTSGGIVLRLADAARPTQINTVTITNAIGNPSADALQANAIAGTIATRFNGASTITTTQTGGAAVSLSGTANSYDYFLASGSVLTGSYGLKVSAPGQIDLNTMGFNESLIANGSAVAGVYLRGGSASFEGAGSNIQGFATGVDLSAGSSSVTTTGGTIAGTTAGISAVSTNGPTTVSSGSAITAPIGIKVVGTTGVAVTTVAGGTIDSTAASTGTGITASTSNGSISVNVGATIGGNTSFATGVQVAGSSSTVTVGPGASVVASSAINAALGDLIVQNQGSVVGQINSAGSLYLDNSGTTNGFIRGAGANQTIVNRFGGTISCTACNGDVTYPTDVTVNVLNAGQMSTAGLSVTGVEGSGSGTITNAATGVMQGGTNTIYNGQYDNAIQYGSTGPLTFSNYGSATTARSGGNAVYATSSGSATINLYAGSTTGNISLGSGDDVLALYNGRGTAGTATVDAATGIILQNAGTLAPASFSNISLGDGTNTLVLAGTGDGTAVNGTAGTIAASYASGATKLVKQDAGTWFVTGTAGDPNANSAPVANGNFSGGTTVLAGTLAVEADPSTYGSNALGTGAVAISSGATVRYDNPFTTQMPGPSSAQIYVSSNQVTGTGTLSFTGATGSLTVLDHLGGAIEDVALSAGGLIAVQSGAVLARGIGIFAGNQARLDIATGASFDGESAITVDALTGGGSFSGTGSLTVGVAGGTGTFSGTIADGPSALALTKTGAGTQTLSNASTYSGDTTISAGTLTLTGSGSLANSRVVANGTLNVSGAGTVSGVDTINKIDQYYTASNGVTSTIAGSGATLNYLAATYRVNSTIAFTNAANIITDVLTTDTSDNQVFYDVLSGNALIGTSCTASATQACLVASGTTQDLVPTIKTLNGGEGLSEDGQSTYTALIGDKYGLGTNISSLAGTGNVTLGTATLTLNNGNDSFSGAITGTGGLTVNGTGKEVLTGAGNTYSGVTTIGAGETLQGSTQSLSALSNVVENGTLAFVQAASGTFAPAISGSGKVTVAGLVLTGGASNANTLTLTGNETQTGGIVVADASSVAITGKAYGAANEVRLQAASMLSNGGTIVGTTYGVEATATGASVVNTGTIASGTYNAATGAITLGGVDGVYLASYGTVNNQAGGLIRGAGQGVEFNAGGGRINNAGTITSTGTGNAVADFSTSNAGVVVANSGIINFVTPMTGAWGVALFGTGINTVVNTGLISADVGVELQGPSATAVTNGQSATITGTTNSLATVGAGTVTLANYGTITGPLSVLATGANNLSLLAGSTTAPITTGAGNDTINLYTGSVTAASVVDATTGLTLQTVGTHAAATFGAIALGAGSNTLDLVGIGDGSMANGAAATLDLAITTGATTLNKTGSGTWTLTDTGTIKSTAGITQLNAGNGGMPGSGGLLAFNGTTGLTTAIAVNGAKIQALTAGAFGTGTITTIDPTVEYSATGTYANNIVLASTNTTSDPTNLQADNGVNATLSGTISEATTGQPLVINTAGGTGTITLTGTNSYTGLTTVAGGTLAVDGSNVSAASVSSGATLTGTGSLGATMIANGGILSGVQGNTLTMASLGLSSGSVINATFSGANGAALFAVDGNLTLAGTVNVASTGAFGLGVYRLASYSGTLTDNGLAIGTTPSDAQRVAVQTSVAGQVNIVNAAGVVQYWDGGDAALHDNGAINGGSGTWTATSPTFTDANGQLNTSMSPQPGFAVFEAAPGTVTVDGSAGAIAVTGMQFASDGYVVTGDSIELAAPTTVIRVGDGTNAGAGYTTTIASALTGVNGLNKTDLGTLILSGANSYAGATTVSAGTLIGTTDSIVGSNIVDNGVLNYNQATTGIAAQAISGTGTVQISGGGAVALIGAVTAQGGVQVGAGSTASLSDASGATGAEVTFLGDSATLNVAAGGNVTATGGNAVSSSSANNTLNNSGTVVGGPTFTAVAFSGLGGDTIANSGTISGYNAVYDAGALTLTNGGMLTGSGSSAVATYGALNVSNTGTISATTNGYALYANAGGTIANRAGGTISGNEGIYTGGSATIDNDGTIASRGAGDGIDVGGSGTITNHADGSINANGDSNAWGIDVASSGVTVTNAGAITAGSGLVTQAADTSFTNSGTITAQTYGVWGNAAPLTLTNSGAIAGGTAGVRAEAAGSTITNAGSITASATGGQGVFMAGGTLTNQAGGAISGNGAGAAILLTGTGNVVNLEAASTTNGLVDGSAANGTNSYMLAGALNGGLTAGSGADSVTLITGGSVSGTINGGTGSSAFLLDGTGAGTLNVGQVANFASRTKNGSGSFTLTGTDSATTPWTINAGTLSVSGGNAINDGAAVTINAAGTLDLASSETIGSLAGTGDVTLGANTLTTGADNSSTSFTGMASGTGGLTKVGTGVLTLSGANIFTGATMIEAGTLQLGATNALASTSSVTVATGARFNLASYAQTIGSLAGAGAITLGTGGLTVDQAVTTNFDGSITGAGSLTKTGSGSLNLTGVSTYAGPTTINGGRLAVNGSITSPVAVNAGGILGGNGSVGSVTIGSGGTYAPGNSIGAQTVNGNVTFAPGATYEVQTDAAGNADRINATGTATLNGGTVEVLAAAGTYARQTNYTILTAAGGVTGKFAAATSNMAFLSPLLTYGADTVSLTLARNDLTFGAIATNQRELAVANAIAARGFGDTIYNTVLFEGSGDAQRTFSQLSGEIHASLPSELADAGRRVRGAILDHLTPEEGLGIWGQGLQSYAASRPQAGLDRIQSNRTGGLGGVDYAQNGITLGLNAGYLDDEVRISAAASHAHVKMSFLGATAGIVRDGVFLRVGGTFAWQQVDTSRVISAPGFATTLYASPRANSAELFGEAGYDLTSGPVKLTPFVGNAYNWTRIRAFTETGGIAALHVDRDSRNTDFLSAGIRLTGSTPVSGKVVLLPRVTVSYQHGFGDLNGSSVAELGGTGPSFAITGVRLGRNALNTETGLDLQIGSRLTIGGSGFASTSREWSDYGAKASIGLRF